MTIDECPVSYVTAESWALLDALLPALELHETAGIAVTELLPGVREDARWMDALLVLHRARSERKAALDEALG